MKIKLKIEKEFDVKYLVAECNIRYPGDGIINGIPDETGDLTPCFNKSTNLWRLIIEVDTGIIRNWGEGKEAKVHYKVCDGGIYTLLDKDFETIHIMEGYVPSIMCPGDEGFGDYIIMDINPQGQIEKWRPNLEEFID